MKTLLLPRWLRWWGVGCLLILTMDALGADGKAFIVQKGIQYVQGSAAAPLEDLKNGVVFEATARASTNNVVKSVLLQPPAGSAQALPVDAPDEFQLKRKFDTQNELETAFPNGTFTLTVSTLHDGQRVLALPLAGDAYPNVPRLGNYDATQEMDTGAYFLFTWDAFAGGTPNDLVQLHIENSDGEKVFETPDVDETDALNGTATSVLISPETLPAGKTLEAVLIFAKTVTRDTASYPGAVGLSQYYKRTKFNFHTSANASQAVIKLFQVQKSRHFSQSSEGAPVLQTSKTWNFDLSVDARTTGTVSTVSVLLPGGAQKTLVTADDGKSFSFGDDALVQSGFDATYPNGRYSFEFGTTAGVRSAQLELTGDFYPNPPHINNWPTERLNPNSDVHWSWDPFAGGTSSDFAQLHVEDDLGNKVFETPDFGKKGTLDGTALGATIPQGTLLSAKTYTARVIFQKNLALQTSTYPGALGVPSYASRTTFKFSTAASGVPEAPALSALPYSVMSGVLFVIEGAAGRTMHLDGSTDLRQWTPVSTNTLPATGQVTLSPPDAGTLPYRFYRAVLMP